MEKKTAMDYLLDNVEWKETEITHKEGTLYATHEGVLHVDNHTFRVYQLNDGRRMLHAEDVEEYFNKHNS